MELNTLSYVLGAENTIEAGKEYYFGQLWDGNGDGKSFSIPEQSPYIRTARNTSLTSRFRSLRRIFYKPWLRLPGLTRGQETTMKYIVMDYSDGDYFTEEFEDKEEAIREADGQWERLTRCEQKHRTAFYVLESINPDEDAPDHYDGDIVKRWK